MYKYIFFDFDGTIVNSIEGTKKSALYALNYFGIDESQNENLGRFFCGPPLKETFKRYNLTSMQIDKAIKLYRDYQANFTIECNNVYEGIEEVLKKLKKENKKIYVVTAKLEETTIKILKYLKIDKYFDNIYGATGKRLIKDEIMNYAINNIENFKEVEAIMIGDRASDIVLGIKNNMDTIGVLYGIDDKKTLGNVGAKYFISRPIEMLNIIK